VGIGALALWLIGGVRPDELARYLCYEAVFVIGPGWLVLRALAPGIRGRWLQLAIGWPIGLTLEILAFIVTAALGARGLFLAYPVLVALPAVLVLRRRRSPGAVDGGGWLTSAEAWVVCGLALLAFAYLGVSYFMVTPLPGTAAGVVYPSDTTFHIAVAASALHGWPPADFRVSGQPFHYHWFSNVDMAATSQVTGIGLPVTVTRLFPVSLSALLVLQLALAGRALTGRRWVGPVTVAIFLLVRGIDFSLSDGTPFGGVGIAYLAISPSQLLGMTLFVPALVVLAALLDPAVSSRVRAPDERVLGLWAVLALLLVGAGGAKSAILPVVAGGLALYAAWVWLRSRRIDRTAVIALGLSLTLGLIFYVLMYRGGSFGLHIDPPGTIKGMSALERIHAAWPDGSLADAAYWALAVPFGTLMYFGAPLLGVALWLRRRPRPVPPFALLSIGLLIAGAAAFFLLLDEFGEQTYFTTFGLIAVMPLAALGLVEYFGSGAIAQRPARLRLALIGAAWTSAAVWIAFRADDLATGGHVARADLVALLPVIAGIGLLVLGALVSSGSTRSLLAAAAVMVAILAAALDTPLDVIPARIAQLEDGTPAYNVSRAGLRPREYDAMEWIRDHLPDDAVLAVSNDRTPTTVRLGPVDGDYPAFTEHRTFREGWAYTARANQVGQRNTMALRIDPFPRRTALERAVYGHADRGALRQMIDDYGVTDIVVSRKDGRVNPRVYSLGRLIFRNGAVDVIELPGAGS
jgi:hypothetical protein